MVDKTCVSQVVELLKLEAEAIAQAADRLQAEQVERAVRLLVDCEGKIVLIGVGKSGIVARKIAATLTSVGTMAVYLHPSDALHGDLGIVTSKDVAVVLSSSGETDEVIGVLPYLKRRQVPLIAIVGNLTSTLAHRADVVLNASVDKEACPYNLAPTTSTTVALAIGDALAMTLMTLKGFTQEDFARNHPSGRLGKRLTLRVKDLMRSGTENPTVSPHASVIQVVGAIGKAGLGAVNVVDDDGCLVGLITDGDVRRCLQEVGPSDLATLVSAAIMTRHPVVVPADALAYDALRLMEDRPSQISVLPVVDRERRCLGLIRLHDIVRSGL